MNLNKESESKIIDKENKNFIMFMCKKCKFYKDVCIKKRIPKKCAEKGLKIKIKEQKGGKYG